MLNQPTLNMYISFLYYLASYCRFSHSSIKVCGDPVIDVCFVTLTRAKGVKVYCPLGPSNDKSTGNTMSPCVRPENAMHAS